MSRGYITIAVGNEYYYYLAKNLALSYAYNRDDEDYFPLGVITDEAGSRYLSDYYDDMIIAGSDLSAKDKQKGFNLKLRIYDHTPYDETIFIDSDSLIFKNPDFLFDWFELNNSEVSVIGRRIPASSEYSRRTCFFSEQAIKDYKLLEYPSFNGGVYYFKKSDRAKECLDFAKEIMEHHYDECGMIRFNGKKGDEPAYALAMAVYEMRPVVDKDGAAMKFNNRNVTYRDISILSHKCSIVQSGESFDPAIFHISTINTYRSYYRNAVLELEAYFDDKKPDPLKKLAVTLGEPARMFGPVSKFLIARTRAKLKNGGR
ncbi:MAG: hypothetical protein IJT91_06095 [Clostridia bacterium]|nr:hypothetical protein [Clostridia bacterium]